MISIITPVVNGSKHIELCINNIIGQACRDAEHIIMDGGSTDATVSIIRSYAGGCPHIRWVSQADRGQSDALNKGIAMASGDIIGVLNVDDYYEPGALNRVVDLFRSLSEPSLVIGNCNMWDDEGRLIDINKPARLRPEDLLIGDEARYPFPVNPSAYFYHRSLHDRIGYYDIDEHYAMDIDFLLRAIPRANVIYVDEVLGNYRLVPGTKTFTDIGSGSTARRFREMLRKYRKKLPPALRIKVIFLGALFACWRSLQRQAQRSG